MQIGFQVQRHKATTSTEINAIGHTPIAQ